MLYIQQAIDYDKKFDVLYCKIANTDNSYGDEIDDNIVVLRDIETDNITGVTIIGYGNIKHMSSNLSFGRDYIST